MPALFNLKTMKNFCILCLAAASLLSQMLHSQNTGHIEIPLNNNADSWENVLEELLDGSFLDDEKLEQFAVQLEELHDNPININRATAIPSHVLDRNTTHPSVSPLEQPCNRQWKTIIETATPERSPSL